MRGDRVEERVAVRRRLLHLARADHGGAAGLVLDDHRDAERGSHLLRDGARLDVGLAARRKRHDDAHRLSGKRKILGLRNGAKREPAEHRGESGHQGFLLPGA